MIHTLYRGNLALGQLQANNEETAPIDLGADDKEPVMLATDSDKEDEDEGPAMLAEDSASNKGIFAKCPTKIRPKNCPL